MITLSPGFTESCESANESMFNDRCSSSTSSGIVNLISAVFSGAISTLPDPIQTSLSPEKATTSTPYLPAGISLCLPIQPLSLFVSSKFATASKPLWSITAMLVISAALRLDTRIDSDPEFSCSTPSPHARNAPAINAQKSSSAIDLFISRNLSSHATF